MYRCGLHLMCDLLWDWYETKYSSVIYICLITVCIQYTCSVWCSRVVCNKCHFDLYLTNVKSLMDSLNAGSEVWITPEIQRLIVKWWKRKKNYENETRKKNSIGNVIKVNSANGSRKMAVKNKFAINVCIALALAYIQ